MKADFPMVTADQTSSVSTSTAATAVAAGVQAPCPDSSCSPGDSCGPQQACRHLRTKRMFIPAQADGALDVASERNDRAFYWCNMTLSEIGRDDQPVHTRVCLSHRRCYEEL